MPSYGVPGGSSVRCLACKLPGDVDILNKNKLCSSCEKVRANYGPPGSKKASMCVGCAPSTWVNVLDPMCTVCSKKQPVYGKVGTSKATMCFGCAPKDGSYVDVKNPKCATCGKSAAYGVPGLKPTMCSEHYDKAAMIKFPRLKCCTQDCRETSTHRLNSDRYCEDHAPANAVDFAQRECLSCKLICILDADNLCASCCGPAKIRTKVKENAVRDILEAHGIPIVSQDRMLHGGECIRTRPDFVIDAGTHLVMLECDEHGHPGYVKLCETSRMINLSQAAQGLGTIFIRYNPDHWKTADGKPGKVTQQRRIRTLIDWVRRAMSAESNPAETGAFCSVKYLFYDGYDVDDKSTTFETLLAV